MFLFHRNVSILIFLIFYDLFLKQKIYVQEGESQRKEEFNELKNFIRKIPPNEREEVKVLLEGKTVFAKDSIVAIFKALSEDIKIEELQI